jgi:hypothetical protein
MIASARRALAVAALAAGCGAATPGATGPTLQPEEPIALLPSGIEAVVEVDDAQLAAWPGRERLLAALPASLRERLAGWGFDPLGDAARMALAGSSLGGESSEWVVAAGGRFDRGKLAAAASGDGALDEQTYHGAAIVDGGAHSFALLDGGKRLVAGGRTTVRRAIDVALGNDEPAARSGEDRALFAALARAPEAKRGRAAARFALRMTDPLRALFTSAGFDLGPLAWLSGAVAVGDGIDVGIVAAARDAGGGDELQAKIQERLSRWRDERLVRALGLAPFLGEVKTGRKGGEVHLALRLEQRRWDRLLAKLQKLGELARGAQE